MPRPARQSRNGVLLVEGQDDEHAIMHICDKLPPFSVSWGRGQRGIRIGESSISITSKNGADALLAGIPGEVRRRNLQALGVVIDANSDMEARWKQIVDRFASVNIRLPASPNPDGTIVERGEWTPRVGVWMMPDNQSVGEIEDFALKLIPNDDAVLPRAQRYIEEIPIADRKFAKLDVAIVHAWLAARKEPGRMGAAIGAGDLHVSGDLCRKFADWLQELYR